MEANGLNLAVLSVSLRSLLLPHCFDTSPELFPEEFFILNFLINIHFLLGLSIFLI